MGKFYASATAIFLVGVGLFSYASLTANPRWGSILYFVGATFIMTGAASFILTFGYHVRSASNAIGPGRGSDRP